MEERVKTGCKNHFVQTDQARLHYWSAGEGNPIVFLHSIPGLGQDWFSVMNVLSSLGQCLALDFPGFGESTSAFLAFGPEHQLNYLSEWIDVLKLEQITFVLHGYGSAIGLDYILKNPKKCRAIVFYDPFLMPEKQSLSLPMQQQLFLADSMQNHYLKDKELCRTLVKQIVSESTESMSQEQIEQYSNQYLQSSQLPLALKAYFSSLQMNSEFLQKIFQNTQQLLRIKVPKLLLYSVPGLVLDVATIEWAKQNIQKMEVMEIGDEWHFAHLTWGSRMGECISAWLQAVEQTKGRTIL